MYDYRKDLLFAYNFIKYNDLYYKSIEQSFFLYDKHPYIERFIFMNHNGKDYYSITYKKDYEVKYLSGDLYTFYDKFDGEIYFNKIKISSSVRINEFNEKRFFFFKDEFSKMIPQIRLHLLQNIPNIVFSTDYVEHYAKIDDLLLEEFDILMKHNPDIINVLKDIPEGSNYYKEISIRDSGVAL